MVQIKGAFSSRWGAVVWALVFLFVGFWHTPGDYEYPRLRLDYWSTKWYFCLVLISIFIGFKIAKKLTWSAGLTFAYTCISSLSIFQWYKNWTFAFNDELIITIFQFYCASTCASFLFVTIFAASIKKESFQNIRTALGLACIANSLWVIWQIYSRFYQGGAFVSFMAGGFVDQGSVNACLIACLFPFWIEIVSALDNWSVIRFLLKCIPIFAIVNTCLLDGASNGFGVTIIVLTTIFLIKNGGIPRINNCGIVGIIIAIGTIIFYHFNKGLFDSSGRFQMYRYSLSWFKGSDLFYQLFGTGNGTFYKLGPKIQDINKFMQGPGSRWPWLHSDWLQIFLFDLGIIGGLLVLWVFIDCLRGARKDRYLFPSLLGCASTAIFQYPLRISIFACLIGLVASMSLSNLRPTQESFDLI